jgi:hypothetical protein
VQGPHAAGDVETDAARRDDAAVVRIERPEDAFTIPGRAATFAACW